MKYRLGVLVSYAFLKNDLSMLDHLLSIPFVDVLVDSGAYSAYSRGEEIDIEEYVTFLREYEDRLWRYIALDVIGDRKQSWRNFEQMLRLGMRPIPVLQFPGSKDELERMYAATDLVAVGGLVLPGRKGRRRNGYVQMVMEWANGRPVHLLGFGDVRYLSKFRPYSCDSSNWCGAGMFGNIQIYLGSGRWFSRHWRWFVNNGDIPKSVLRILMRDYLGGFSADCLLRPDMFGPRKTGGVAWKERFGMHLTVRSYVKFGYDLFRSFGVRYFYVAISKDYINLLESAALYGEEQGWFSLDNK